ncbi:hypothetical protein BLNAU_18076 [Blattamonas nauphoetae]|uniref:IBR domain-containing protein n=1 Tax=Blattamonas nauphoetae TaxID=2049346 RepID=A0ABQ9X9W2_9EUKA|nr:hypothetical protein BLNAU_18076 [Blattamonas nauphoetae]
MESVLTRNQHSHTDGGLSNSHLATRTAQNTSFTDETVSQEADKRHELYLKVTAAMDSAFIRYCPNCSAPIVFGGGCNYVKCCHCDCKFCILCMFREDPIIAPIHSHYKAEASTCQLFTPNGENDHLHHRRARAAGIRAEEEWRRENPSFSHIDFDILAAAIPDSM